MARKHRRAEASSEQSLKPHRRHCLSCGRWLWVAYYRRRTVTTLAGVVRLRLQVRRCVNRACHRYHQAYGGESPFRMPDPFPL